MEKTYKKQTTNFRQFQDPTEILKHVSRASDTGGFGQVYSVLSLAKRGPSTIFEKHVVFSKKTLEKRILPQNFRFLRLPPPLSPTLRIFDL